jgi:hypothetical protein
MLMGSRNVFSKGRDSSEFPILIWRLIIRFKRDYINGYLVGEDIIPIGADIGDEKFHDNIYLCINSHQEPLDSCAITAVRNWTNTQMDEQFYKLDLKKNRIDKYIMKVYPFGTGSLDRSNHSSNFCVDFDIPARRTLFFPISDSLKIKHCQVFQMQLL